MYVISKVNYPKTASGESAIFSILRPLFLASASPRRSAFFAELGLPIACIHPAKNTEPLPLPGENPEDYTLRAARLKAANVLANLPSPAAVQTPSPVIIAADTVVVLDNVILGKPRDTAHAFAMLKNLAGKTHTVITGCAVFMDAREHSFTERTSVSMWDCPEALLRAYARSAEPADKAGAYAVQGAGACLVRSIEGSWSNVVGLPLSELVRTLLTIGAIESAIPVK